MIPSDLTPLLLTFGRALRRKDNPEDVSLWLAKKRSVCVSALVCGQIAYRRLQGCGYCVTRSMLCVPFNGTSRCAACSKSHEKCSLQGEYRRHRVRVELGVSESEFQALEVRTLQPILFRC